MIQKLESKSADIDIFRTETQTNTLVISFGGVNGRFEFYGSLSKLNVDFILIREPSKRWYQHGLQDIKGGFQGFIKYLSELIAEHEDKKLVVVGASAGGYAAILFGSLLNADQIISYGPQTYISDELRGPLNERRWWPELKNITELHYGDLLPVVSNNLESKIHIFFGSDDFFDFLHAAHLIECPNVTISMIENGDHGVSGTMKRDGLLIPSLKCGIEQQDGLFPGVYLSKSEEGQALVSGLIQGELPLNQETLREVKSIWPMITGVDFMLGKQYMQGGDFRSAADIYKRIAYRELFSNFVFMSQIDLGFCLQKAGDYIESEALFKKAEQRKPFSQGVLISYARLLSELGRFDEAEALLFRCVIHNPNYVGGYYALALVLIERGKPKMAIDCLIKARDLGASLKHIDTLLLKLYLDSKNKLQAHRLINNIKAKDSIPAYLDSLESMLKEAVV